MFLFMFLPNSTWTNHTEHLNITLFSPIMIMFWYLAENVPQTKEKQDEILKVSYGDKNRSRWHPQSFLQSNKKLYHMMENCKEAPIALSSICSVECIEVALFTVLLKSIFTLFTILQPPLFVVSLYACFVFVLSGLNELHYQLRNYTKYLILDRFLPALNFICHVLWWVSWSELKWVFLSSAWAGRREVKLFSNTCAWEGIFSEIKNLHM